MFVAKYFPGMLFPIWRILSALMLPLRLKYKKEYIRRYKEIESKFAVGATVRVRKIESSYTITLSPAVQEIVLDHEQGKPDEAGMREWKSRTPSVGTISDSLFEKHEPWVIEILEIESLSDWLHMKIVRGMSNGYPGGAILCPLIDTQVSWPEVTKHGRNRVWLPLQLLELVPPDEVMRFKELQSPGLT